MEKKMYAVSVYERWDDGEWEFIGYVKVYHTRNEAIEFAYRITESSFHACYYDVEVMSESMVRAGGIEDLIES
jgi:hypothetical protein